MNPAIVCSCALSECLENGCLRVRYMPSEPPPVYQKNGDLARARKYEWKCQTADDVREELARAAEKGKE